MGWRWIEGFLAVFTGTLSIIYIFTVPETFAPRILHNRAVALTKMHGAVYRTQMEMKQGRKKLIPTLKGSLSRPWVLLLEEPIVLIFSIYQAVVYATLYMCFGKGVHICGPQRLICCYSCISHRLPRAKRLVTRTRRPGISGRHSRHAVHSALQHLDQQTVRQVERRIQRLCTAGSPSPTLHGGCRRRARRSFLGTHNLTILHYSISLTISVRLDKLPLDPLDREHHSRCTLRLCHLRHLSGHQQLPRRLVRDFRCLRPRGHSHLPLGPGGGVPLVHGQDVCESGPTLGVKRTGVLGAGSCAVSVRVVQVRFEGKRTV